MEHWDKIRPGLWIDKRNRFTGGSIWWTKDCQACPLRAEVEMSERETSFCLWGAVRLLTRQITGKERVCFKDRKGREAIDTEEWVNNNIHYSANNIPPQFENEWQWTFPGKEWLELMEKIGRSKARKQRKINYTSPEEED